LKTLHAFIICWAGKEENVETIARSIVGVADRVTVIYSTQDESERNGSGEWVQVPNEWFYGRKFRRTLELSTADITLQIQGDVSCGDWKTLIERCRHVYETTPAVGIWAPEVDYTWWDTEAVGIHRDVEKQLTYVSNTDGIIWSFSKSVRERLSQFTYEMNNFGWGVECAAIAHAYANNMLVLRDMTTAVVHPVGCGYGRVEASQQMATFLEQLTPQEAVMHRLVWDYGYKRRLLSPKP
jgi:uncharacterized membrane protein